jgi:hypothetical protein
MTRKVYKSAMGRDVDLGALLLQNEHTRAVGNMNVNARGDLLDSANKVIDTKNRRVQRQYKKTTNVSSTTPVHSGTRAAKAAKLEPDVLDDFQEDLAPAVEETMTIDTPVVRAPAPVSNTTVEDIPSAGGGLAAAIARSRLIKQEKEKTLRERNRESGVKKI